MHAILFNGNIATYRGSGDAAGEVAALRPPNRTVTGIIRDNVFTGQRLIGAVCHFSVQMRKAIDN
jgi:hypothetical protein